MKNKVIISITLGILLSLFYVSASTTFFDNPDEFFIMNRTVLIAPPSPPGGGGGAPAEYKYNETIICNNAYSFIIKHITSNGTIIYTLNELGNLTANITLELNYQIDKVTVQGYVDDYDNKCFNITGKKIPKAVPSIIPAFISIEIEEECSPNIKSKLLFMPMNASFPFWEWGGINFGEMECDSINFWRWMLKFEKSEDGYILKGLRIYPFVIMMLLTVLTYLIWFFTRMRRKVRKIANKYEM